MDKKSHYQQLFDAYVKVYPSKSMFSCQTDINKIWADLKKDKLSLPSKSDLLIKHYSTLALKKGIFAEFFV